MSRDGKSSEALEALVNTHLIKIASFENSDEFEKLEEMDPSKLLEKLATPENICHLPTDEIPGPDPRKWLEDPNGKAALAWARGQSSRTMKSIRDPEFDEKRQELAKSYARPDNLSIVRRGRYGEFVDNLHRDNKNHPLGLWRRVSWEEYQRIDDPAWETIFDLDEHVTQHMIPPFPAKAIPGSRNDSEKEMWRLQEVLVEPTKQERALVLLSLGGSDSLGYLEYDIINKTLVQDGFRIRARNGNVIWQDPDTIVFQSDWDGEYLTSSTQKPRAIRQWKRGTKVEEAKAVFTIPKDSVFIIKMGWIIFEGRLRLCIRSCEKKEGKEVEVTYLWESTYPDQKVQLDLDSCYHCHLYENWLLALNTKEVEVSRRKIPSGCFLATPALDALSKNWKWSTVFERNGLSTTQALKSFHRVPGGRIINILHDNLSPRVLLHTQAPSTSTWQAQEVRLPPRTGEVYITQTDSKEKNSELLVLVQYQAKPSELFLIDANKSQSLDLSKAMPIKRAPGIMDTPELRVVRGEVPIHGNSKSLVYFEVDEAGNDSVLPRPVVVTGYGGFNHVETLTYSETIHKMWHARGGKRLHCHTRGGAEFGLNSARGETKIDSQDDLARIVDYFFNTNKNAIPDMTAAIGGSDAGLRIANLLTRYPDRFRALVSENPITDLFDLDNRTLFPFFNWKDEYGIEWETRAPISAYHHIKSQQSYPDILFISSTTDDRVPPGHARKAALKLLDLGYEKTYYYESSEGGHVKAMDYKDLATLECLKYTFLWESLQPPRRSDMQPLSDWHGAST